MNKKAVISGVIISVIINLLFGGLLIGAGVVVLGHEQVFGMVLSGAYALIGAVIEMLVLTHAFDYKLASGCGIVMMIFGIITAVFAIVYLVAGLAGLSKAIKRAKEKEQSTVEQSDSVLPTVQKQVPDLPLDLPAGVNPDDL